MRSEKEICRDCEKMRVIYRHGLCRACFNSAQTYAKLARTTLTATVITNGKRRATVEGGTRGPELRRAAARIGVQVAHVSLF